MNAEHAYAIRNYLILCREAELSRDTTRYLWDGIRAEVLPALHAADLDHAAELQHRSDYLEYVDAVLEDIGTKDREDLDRAPPPDDAGKWTRIDDNGDGTSTITGHHGPDCPSHTHLIAVPINRIAISVLSPNIDSYNQALASLTEIPNQPPAP